jgi:hypothetical protein
VKFFVLSPEIEDRDEVEVATGRINSLKMIINLLKIRYSLFLGRRTSASRL